MDQKGAGSDLPEESGPMAVVMSSMPEVWARLLVEHVPDRLGRCRACATGNGSGAGVPWPCTLQVIAADARLIYLAGQDACA